MNNITVKDIVEAVSGTLLCGDEDCIVKNISIDSRIMKGSDLFVPIIGEKNDAHDFINQAVQNGAAAVLTSRHTEMISDTPYIKVTDTKAALQALGSYLRNRIMIPIIGITGSVGKTTTREMIAAALSAGYRVFKTPGNHNSQIGVPLTISSIEPEDEIGVLELGMSEPGELSVIAKIARPDSAVITNIGITHIEQLKSRENIYREKLSIQDGLKHGGILYLNSDDDMLECTVAEEKFRTIYFGTSKKADYRAEDIVLTDGYPEFTADCRGKKFHVTLKVMGRHNVLNAMAALAVADEYNVSLNAAISALGEYTGFKNRQQIYVHDGITIIDDTYNASPASMRAALDVLSSMKTAKRRIAVLADMKELGENASIYHEETGKYAAAQNIDAVYTLGELAVYIKNGIKSCSDMKVVSFEDKQVLKEYLEKDIKKGDCILFKGSNSMKLGELAEQFIR